MKETVAFGRHVDGPPKKVYTPPPSGTFESFGFDSGKHAFYSKTFFLNLKSDHGISVGRFFNTLDNLLQQAEPTLYIGKVNFMH